MSSEEVIRVEEEFSTLVRGRQAAIRPLPDFWQLSCEKLKNLADFAGSKLSSKKNEVIKLELVEGMDEIKYGLVQSANEVPNNTQQLRSKDAKIFGNTLTHLSDIRKNLLNCFIDDVIFDIPQDCNEYDRKHFEDLQGLKKFNYYNLFLRYKYPKEKRLAWDNETRPRIVSADYCNRIWYTKKQKELLQAYWAADASTRELWNQERHWNDADSGRGKQWYDNVGRGSPEDPAMKSTSVGNIFLAVGKYMENMYFVMEILQTWQDTFNFEKK